jgi:hypothetical protein
MADAVRLSEKCILLPNRRREPATPGGLAGSHPGGIHRWAPSRCLVALPGGLNNSQVDEKSTLAGL